MKNQEWTPINEGDELPSVHGYLTLEPKNKKRFVSSANISQSIIKMCINRGWKPIAYMPIIVPEPYNK